MKTEFGNVIENIKITIPPDKASDVYDHATSSESLLNIGVESVSTLLSMAAESDAPPSADLVSDTAYTISHLNALRKIFKRIADDANKVMSKNEVSK